MTPTSKYLPDDSPERQRLSICAEVFANMSPKQRLLGYGAGTMVTVARSRLLPLLLAFLCQGLYIQLRYTFISVARWRFGRFLKQQQREQRDVASQAKIGVCVQAPVTLLRGSGGISSPEKNLEIVIAKSCNVVHFGILKRFNNGNSVPTRSPGSDPCLR